jgi:hypothetical protein
MLADDLAAQAAQAMGLAARQSNWWSSERMPAPALHAARQAAVVDYVVRPGWAAWTYIDKRGETRAAQLSLIAYRLPGDRYEVRATAAELADFDRMWLADHPGGKPTERPQPRQPKPPPELRALWRVECDRETAADGSTRSKVFLVALTGPAGMAAAAAWAINYEPDPVSAIGMCRMNIAADHRIHGGRPPKDCCCLGRWPGIMDAGRRPTPADLARLMDEGRAHFGSARDAVEYTLVATLMAPDAKLAAALRRRLARRTLTRM